MVIYFSFFIIGTFLLTFCLVPPVVLGPSINRSVMSYRPNVLPDFDIKIHCVTLFSGLAFAVLIFAHLTPVVSYVVAGVLILIIFGLFDNLLGLLPLRGKFRSEIHGGLAHMLISALFAAHFGNFLGTASYALPIWVAVPAALFSLLSILKVMTLLERTSTK